MCEALERYVEAELRGHETSCRFNGITVHLSRCVACQTDHEGLLAFLQHEGRI